VNSLIRKMLVAAAISTAALGAYADGGGIGPDELHQLMVKAGMNKDGMVAKKDIMKMMEQALKKADPKGTGMFDEAMMSKFVKEFFSGGGN
jgi:hypothetical protein